jgi:heme/copper-type cytochrome/quinol oxidase subunit 4
MEGAQMMKYFLDLALKIALVITIVLTNLISDELIKSIVILSLTFLAILLVIFKFKTEEEIKLQEKISDIVTLLVIIAGSIFIIYRIVNL